MDFANLFELRDSPYTFIEPVQVIQGASVVVSLGLPRMEDYAGKLGLPVLENKPRAPVEVKVDGWPDEKMDSKIFVRVGSQGLGCTLKCTGCDAADQPGYNLGVEEIVYQVVHGLCNDFVDLKPVEELTIAFFGTGENGANWVNVTDAVRRLHKLLPEAKFFLSTSGPKTLDKAEVAFIALAQEGIEVELQISLPYSSQKQRWEYMKVKPGDRSTVTIARLSETARRWHKETGRKVHINLVVGPGFQQWRFWDYTRFWWHFSPSCCVPKVSIEGKQPGNTLWRDAQHRIGRLALLGYKRMYVYDPPGNEEGAGCASLEFLGDQTKAVMG